MTTIIDMTRVNPHVMKKQEIVAYLKHRHLKSSFPRKSDAIAYLRRIRWSMDFPWREEQHVIIQHFLEDPFERIALQGLFGCGKTTMLLGMLNMGFWKNKFRLDEICFCAFNVCIKNEVRKKISVWGVKQKPMVRTFDSIIYELCEFYEYPHLKKPNYEGKRRFIVDVCRKKKVRPFTKYDHVRYLFVDEAQDLEKTCFVVFRTFFKNARMVLVGDIFQSIQKEPRESLLWWITHQQTYPISYFYMKETPRVPVPIFAEIKTALTQFYPEYTDQIREWRSLNTVSDAPIQWVPYDNYKHLYSKMLEFLDEYPFERSMILTFSSCITVRGSLGDLARIRRLIEHERPGIPVNSNYKNMSDKHLFLSTANSSKGLERDYVFVISTFPLEKAFINFSRDLTMNLITVAISRAKQKAIVCVPEMTERYSTAFYSYPSSPRPRYTFFPACEPVGMLEFLKMEHSVTDILRQSVIKYDTRMIYQSFIKKTHRKTCMPIELFHATDLPKSILRSEEERAFVGVCIEVLLTSSWTGKMPKTPSIQEIEFNPMYAHCIRNIKRMRVRYHDMKRRHHNKTASSSSLFQCVFQYTQLFMAIHHKIFFHFQESQQHDLQRYWSRVSGVASQLGPPSSDAFEVQQNIKMWNITGIMDGLRTSSTDKRKHIYEIKASVKSDWKEDAFIQAFIYGIQLGQGWFHIHLVNLFKNEYVEYAIFIDKGVVWARNLLCYDVSVWNMNSFLAKTRRHVRNLEECVFIGRCETETVVLTMMSPTRIVIEFYSTDLEHTRAYLNDHHFDPDKKYILMEGGGGGGQAKTVVIEFPFPTTSYQALFGCEDIDVSGMIPDLTKPSSEQEGFHLHDTIMSQMLWVMVSLITKE